MTCKKCGKRIKKDEKACPYCGEAVSAAVSLGAAADIQAKSKKNKGKKKKMSGTDLALRIALIVVCVLAVLGILFGILYLYARSFIEDEANIDDKPTKSEKDKMHINDTLPTKEQGIINIALFGLDERGETDEKVDGTGKSKSFHSDAIIILTIDRRDKDNPTVKLSSIARDTLVYVDGYGSKGSKTKLTHAFDYGYRKAKKADKEKKQSEADYKREGALTAIAAINYNFNLNVEEYIYVNFVEFMDIIDYVGGVTVKVEQRELNELNKHVRAMRKECNRDIAEVKKAGELRLTGGQALAYSRIRKIDSDLKRTNRQKTVLKALFDEVKDTPVNKLTDVIGKMLGMCHTTLTADEILDFGTWAVTKDPEILNLTMPDTGTEYGYSWIWEGNHPNYGWVWIYDLDYASALLIDFIFGEDTAKDVPRPTMPNEPKVTQASSTVGGSDPIDPTDPTESTDPIVTDPTYPTYPTYPTNPIYPTDPTDPTGGFDPTDPTETGDPTGSTDPTESGDPTVTDPTVTDPTEPSGSEVIGTTGSSEPVTEPSVEPTVPSVEPSAPPTETEPEPNPSAEPMAA